MADQPALFDVPGPERPGPDRPGRGRTRETYARTVVADVVVHDEAALRTAALRVLDGGLEVIPASPDEADELPDPQEEVAESSAAALDWCVELTAGLWPLIDSGAVRIIGGDLGIEEQAQARYRVQWTVTIKLDDAPRAREMALAACPTSDAEARAEIEQSFAAVWNWAASPYAPLDEVPGVSWTPDDVTVEQIMARSRAARPAPG